MDSQGEMHYGFGQNAFMEFDDRPDPARRLKEARIARGFKTAKDACSFFGWNLASYTQHENGLRGLGRQSKKYADGLRVSEAWLLTGEGVGPDGQTIAPEPSKPVSHIIPGSELVSARRMPVYAAAMGGEGHIIVSFDQIDEIKRPSELENVKGGYGLLIKGTSMVPAINEGDLALVNPHLPPVRDANVILYHQPPEGGDAEAIVKQLLSWNDREWTLKQWNPLLEFKEYRVDWPVCHRMVGTYYRR